MTGLALVMVAKMAEKSPSFIKKTMAWNKKAEALMASNQRPLFTIPVTPEKYTINLKKNK